MRILVTGGAGFIGSHYVRFALDAHRDWEVVVVDRLTYAGDISNLGEAIGDPRCAFVQGDITDSVKVESVFEDGHFDAVVNFAAESHVDRSILDAGSFVRTNVEGTRVLLDAVRLFKIGRFLQVSTDEVYGSITEGSFAEDAPLTPSSPYAASKAAADLLCLAFVTTHRLPVVIVRCSNNYGPNQFPEKLIPLVIHNLLHDAPLPVYGDGKNIRQWLHVSDCIRAIDLVLQSGRLGNVYNVGSRDGLRNIDLVRHLIQEAQEVNPTTRGRIEYVADRPGHDYRYSLDSSKAERELGWTPAIGFAEGIRETVEWYLSRPEWLDERLSSRPARGDGDAAEKGK